MNLTLDELRSFKQALADGVLLDVTRIAESVGFHANIYISWGYWNTPPISRTVEGLKAALRSVVNFFEHGTGTRGDFLDGKVLWTYPIGGLEAGNELASVFRLWRTPENRLHLVILANGETLDFRAARSINGSLYTQ